MIYLKKLNKLNEDYTYYIEHWRNYDIHNKC